MDTTSIVTAESLVAATQPAAGPRVGRGRAKSRRIAPYSWLGVGAVGLGVGAALAGAALSGGSGVAVADTRSDTHVSSPGPASAGGRSAASHPAAAASRPKRTFSRAEPENSAASWATRARRARKSAGSAARMSTPSMVMRPLLPTRPKAQPLPARTNPHERSEPADPKEPTVKFRVERDVLADAVEIGRASCRERVSSPV